MTLTVNVSASAAGSLTNNVTVSGGGEFDTSNDTAADVTTITGTTPDFSITASPRTETIKAGASANYVFTLTPLNGVPFASAITLTTAGLPPGATIVLEPASVTPGSSMVTDTLIVQTLGGDSTPAANLGGNGDRNICQSFAQFLGVGIAFSGIPLVGLGFHKKKWLSRKSRQWVFPLVVGIGFLLAGCGYTKAPPPGTFTITVTATSGIVQHSIAVVLTVNP
jgi:hypothetical protein